LTSENTTISIPFELKERIEKVISKFAGHESVSDYVSRALEETLARDEAPEALEPLTVEEASEIKSRLEALGYL